MDAGSGNTYDYILVRGDDNATQLFEFMSDNVSKVSKMEYSLINTGQRGDKGQNYINNGHMQGSEPAMSHIIFNQLQFGYTIRRTVHCHPKSDYASEGDKDFADDIFDISPKIEHWIYNIPERRYIRYYSRKIKK